MRDAAEAFGRLLFRGDSEAMECLTGAFDDWRPFYKKHGGEYGLGVKEVERQWGGNPPPWNTLIMVANLYKWSAEVDWKEFFDEIVSQITEIVPAEGLTGNWDELAETDPEVDPDEFFRKLADQFQVHGEQLAVLENDTDSMPLTLIRKAEWEQAVALAKSAGGKLVGIGLG